MKSGWYEEKLKRRWRAYQIENITRDIKALTLTQKNIFKEILKINDEAWKTLENSETVLRFEDIPWLNTDILTLKTLRVKKDIRKQLLLRWHPDRFLNSKIWSQIHDDDKEKVKLHLNELCEAITLMKYDNIKNETSVV